MRIAFRGLSSRYLGREAFDDRSSLALRQFRPDFSRRSPRIQRVDHIPSGSHQATLSYAAPAEPAAEGQRPAGHRSEYSLTLRAGRELAPTDLKSDSNGHDPIEVSYRMVR